jgi:hypothetical protein
MQTLLRFGVGVGGGLQKGRGIKMEVPAATITAAASMALALWSLVTAYLSRSLALSAEEKAKRGELVRVKALGAIQIFLDALAELFFVVSGLRFLREHKGGVSMQDPSVQDYMKNLGSSRATLYRLQFTSAPYFTVDLNKQLTDILILTQEIKIENLEVIEKRVREIARLFRK